MSSRLRFLRPIGVHVLTNVRVLQVTIFLTSLLLSRLNQPFREQLHAFHPAFSEQINSQYKSINSTITNTVHVLYERQDLIPQHISSLVLTPSLKSITNDSVVALLDSSAAAWNMISALVRLYTHILRGIIHMTHTCFPHVSPIASLCAQEFAALPLRGKIILLTTISVNTLLLIAWRKGVFARFVAKLQVWHQSVATSLLMVGPYTLVLVLVYVPTKNALSFSTFRVTFQWITMSLMMAQSVISCAHLWGNFQKNPPKSPIDTPQYDVTPKPQSARSGFEPGRKQTTPGFFSMTPRFIVEEREQITSLLHHALNMWTVLGVWQFVMKLVYTSLEFLSSDMSIPVFNFWNLSDTSDIVTRRLLLTKGAVLVGSRSLLDANDMLIQGQPVKLISKLTRLIIMMDEIVTLILLLVAMLGDDKAARKLRKIGTNVIEFVIRKTTGLNIKLAAGRSQRSSTSLRERAALFVSVMGAWIPCPEWTRNLLYAHWVADLIKHLMPLTLLLLPVFLLRVVLLVMALVIPIVYSLKALWTCQLPLQTYWLCYFSGLVLCIAAGDLASFSLFVYFIKSVRVKLVCVSLLQFVCVEPKVLGTWMARQATRVSVSALATARRRVAEKSATRSEGDASVPPEPKPVEEPPVSRKDSSSTHTYAPSRHASHTFVRQQSFGDPHMFADVVLPPSTKMCSRGSRRRGSDITLREDLKRKRRREETHGSLKRASSQVIERNTKLMPACLTGTKSK
eukprot:Blabericola_migrator_1__2372@NODE_1665_length_4054_cov_138_103085_g1082_i0_p1_GENE_NODE_1665_length_4054_cov_138_103085_g1082_i0NODE_1665_length_4054_cov_138_103085_g1082_i0_p1_ORF_typecomplete_len738_score113_74SEA/PF01390_20/0_02_NODE_1665_length_4054_cov_138_103085_g1082_i01752388